MTTISYTVTGMTCDHCVRSVEEEVGAVAGVTQVRAELETGTLTITSEAEGEPDRKAIAAAVDEAGYELAP